MTVGLLLKFLFLLHSASACFSLLSLSPLGMSFVLYMMLSMCNSLISGMQSNVNQFSGTSKDLHVS